MKVGTPGSRASKKYNFASVDTRLRYSIFDIVWLKSDPKRAHGLHFGLEGD
jgi:hypothetical protein